MDWLLSQGPLKLSDPIYLLNKAQARKSCAKVYSNDTPRPAFSFYLKFYQMIYDILIYAPSI